MDKAEILISILAGVAGIMGFLGGIFLGVWRGADRLARIEFKVDTLWDYVMRRALSEGVAKNVVTVNSPVSITPEAREWYNNMAEELKAFYRTVGVTLTDRELFIAVESRFGDRILVEICIPHNLHAGSCILAAIEVAKEGFSPPQLPAQAPSPPVATPTPPASGGAGT